VTRLSTAHLAPGARVVTTGQVGEDFGLPVVAPHTRKRQEAHVREVRSTVHARGGVVVRFTDGAKTEPLHGRTAWEEG
jgi:hypothetical protein